MLSSPEEAGEYVKTLQAVLRSVAASDGNMEQVEFHLASTIVGRRLKPSRGHFAAT